MYQEDFTTPIKEKQRETTKRARETGRKSMAEKAAKRAIIVTDGHVVVAKAAAGAAEDAKAADGEADAKAAGGADEAAGDDAKEEEAKASAPGPAVVTAKAKGGSKGNKGKQ